MLTVGFIGWRGMVGSVLLQRMQEEGDFRDIDPYFFSTSQVGGEGPAAVLAAGDAGSHGTVRKSRPLGDAYDLAALRALDCIVTCQGGDYTGEVYRALRNDGWRGFWIDAASTLRMESDAILLLDPVNRDHIERGIAAGIRTFVGANCTVSLMLMAIGGLFREGLVEWVSSMTYQAASGAGAAVMEEVMRQHEVLAGISSRHLSERGGALAAESAMRVAVTESTFPTTQIGVPLSFNVLPFIDKMVEGGRSREEWKGQVEANKILGTTTIVPVDGICVRVGALRSHSQGLTIKLRRPVSLDEATELIASSNEWVRVIPNEKGETLRALTPMAVSGSLQIAIGRIHHLTMGPEYLGAFTVGDQLLWGAAEPLRRFLRMVVAR